MCTKENLEMQEEGCTTLAKRRRRKKGLKFSSKKQLQRAKMERQMGRVTLCDIEDTARVLEFPAIDESESVEIETQDSKQPLIFGHDDDKRVSKIANDMSDAEQEGECTSIFNVPVSCSWFLSIDEAIFN